jgi:hypothetical protein
MFLLNCLFKYVEPFFILAGAEGKNTDLPGILGAIPVKDRN